MCMKTIKNIILFCISLCAILCFAEYAARALDLAPEVYRLRSNILKSAYETSANPVLGYVFKKNYRDTHNPDLHESFPVTNSDGQRDIERSVRKRAGVTRILMLGDSVVAGHGIYDLNNTLSRQLEKKLSGHNIEVLNFGIGGYCFRAEVELLKEKGLRYNPDIVIIVFVPNDYSSYNNQIGHYQSCYFKYLNQLFVESHFIRALMIKFNLLFFAAEQDRERLKDLHQKAMERTNFGEGMRLLCEMRRNNNFKCYIVVWPDFLKDSIQGSAQIERRAAFQNIPCRQLSKYFARHYNEYIMQTGDDVTPSELYTIGDQMHPSEYGASIGADFIMEMLDSWEII